MSLPLQNAQINFSVAIFLVTFLSSCASIPDRLVSADAVVRETALTQLRETYDLDSTELSALINFLKDPDPKRRDWAAFALTQIRPTITSDSHTPTIDEDVFRELAPKIVAALQTNGSSVRHHILEVLTSNFKAFQTMDIDEKPPIQYLPALEQMGVIVGVAKLLMAKDPNVRAHAAQFLEMALGSVIYEKIEPRLRKSLIPLLLGGLKDNDRTVRLSIARCIGIVDPSVQIEIAPVLAEIIGDSSEGSVVRRWAIDRLAKFGAIAKPYIPILVRSLHDITIRNTAIQALAHLDLKKEEVISEMKRRFVLPEPQGEYDTARWGITPEQVSTSLHIKLNLQGCTNHIAQGQLDEFLLSISSYNTTLETAGYLPEEFCEYYTSDGSPFFFYKNLFFARPIASWPNFNENAEQRMVEAMTTKYGKPQPDEDYHHSISHWWRSNGTSVYITGYSGTRCAIFVNDQVVSKIKFELIRNEVDHEFNKYAEDRAVEENEIKRNQELKEEQMQSNHGFNDILEKLKSK